MKNMKITHKLLSGFAIITLLACLVGAVSMIGIAQLRHSSESLYSAQAVPLSEVARMLDHTQRARVLIRDLAINTGDVAQVDILAASLHEEISELERLMASYGQSELSKETRALYEQAQELYTSIFQPAIPLVTAGARAGMPQDEVLAIMSSGVTGINQMVENFRKSMDIKVSETKATVEANNALSQSVMLVMIAVMSISILLAVVLALYISRLVNKPLALLQAFFMRFAKEGDLSMTEDDQKNVATRSKDEIGECIGAAALFAQRLIHFSGCLSQIAGGDLTVSFEVLSDKDSIGQSFEAVVDSLNQMFYEIRQASDQVALGAEQISQSAQSLASGATEQATSIEQFSASVTGLGEKTKTNADDSREAKESNNMAGEKLVESMASMEKMLEAMKAIDESSQKITKVIKVIDDIAFQTNILALNAAVEAARAGMHGKGFAVVAEEVRNLASKSAAAAKETAGLIEESSQKVNEGRKIVEMTNQSMETVMQYAKHAIVLVDNVAVASEAQARSIDDMSHGIRQISEVVQANSAMSEQAAASAQQMSAQSVTVNEILGRFTLKSLAINKGFASETAAKEKAYPSQRSLSLPAGKY